MIREYRKLSLEDHPQVLSMVLEIEQSYGLGADFYWPQGEFQAELWTTEGWGVFLNGILAGFVLYRVQQDIFEITVLGVAPHERRQNLMSDLLRQLIGTLSQGVEIWLEVHEKNLAAQRLYEKVAFQKVGQRQNYYRDGATALLYSFKKA